MLFFILTISNLAKYNTASLWIYLQSNDQHSRFGIGNAPFLLLDEVTRLLTWPYVRLTLQFVKTCERAFESYNKQIWMTMKLTRNVYLKMWIYFTFVHQYVNLQIKKDLLCAIQWQYTYSLEIFRKIKLKSIMLTSW